MSKINIFLLMLIFLSPLLVMDTTDGQDIESNKFTLTGQVKQAVGDFTEPNPTGVEIPAANRQVLIFSGMYQEFRPNSIPSRIVKTDKYGKFYAELEPGIYTVAILVGRDIVPTGVRPDGYIEFFDLVREKNAEINLLDRSSAFYGESNGR